MKYLSLLAVLLLMAFAPNPLAVASSSRVAKNDIWVTYTVVSDNVGGHSDSLSVTVSSPGLPSVIKTHIGASAVDSVLLAGARPAVNGTISGNVSAFAWRRGLVGPTTTQSWSYTEPDVPPGAPGIQAAAHPGT